MLGSLPKGMAPIGRTQYCQMEGWVEAVGTCFLDCFLIILGQDLDGWIPRKDGWTVHDHTVGFGVYGYIQERWWTLFLHPL
jgi:hypothetical protein